MKSLLLCFTLLFSLSSFANCIYSGEIKSVILKKSYDSSIRGDDDLQVSIKSFNKASDYSELELSMDISDEQIKKELVLKNLSDTFGSHRGFPPILNMINNNFFKIKVLVAEYDLTYLFSSHEYIAHKDDLFSVNDLNFQGVDESDPYFSDFDGVAIREYDLDNFNLQLSIYRLCDK